MSGPMQGAVSAAERSMRSVFVGNIPYEATEEQLKDIFSEVGPVVSFRLVYDRETGKPKGYGFCEYKDQEMALSAMRNLNGYELNGRALRVDNAASEKSKEELKNLQASLGGPPVESPFGEAVPPEMAPERIARIVSSLPPEQLFGLMIEMKQCIENNPNEARTLLVQNPQLTYALLQAQVIMKMVEPEMAMAMLHTKSGAPIGFTSSEAKQVPVPNSQVPVPVSDMNNVFQQGVPRAPVQTMPAAAAPLRPTGMSPQAPRPSLLGERPPPMPAPPIPPMAAQLAGVPRHMGDHDLRGPPMADHDMRGPPMMSADKDLRHPMGDQDFRGGSQPGPYADPRYRNAPGPGQDVMANQRAPFDNRRPGPDSRPGFDPRGPMGMQPRLEDVRNSSVVNPVGSPTPGRISNARMAPPNTGSPVVGTNSPSIGSSPRPNNPFAAAAAAIAPHDQEKAALIMQVLQLTDQQIAMLPPEQRQSIMVLKEQIARSQQAA